MLTGPLATIVEQTGQAAGSVSGMVNYSISIGDLLQIATTVIAVVGAYSRLIERLKALEVKLDVLWDDYRRRSRQTRG
jgi:hypothetical protein